MTSDFRSRNMMLIWDYSVTLPRSGGKAWRISSSSFGSAGSSQAAKSVCIWRSSERSKAGDVSIFSSAGAVPGPVDGSFAAGSVPPCAPIPLRLSFMLDAKSLIRGPD